MSAAHILPSHLIAIEPELIQPHELLLSAPLCLIGRTSDCAVQVRLRSVSRRHAQIERRSDHYVLSDLESINGTYINGQRLLAPYRLRNDDQIGLGDQRALLRFIDPDATQVAVGVLRLDERSQSFFLSGMRLDLSPLQFVLLRHLYQRAGEVCDRKSCALAIWGRDYEPELDQGALDTAVSDLRRAMRKLDPASDLIETRRGLGYLLRL